MLVEADGRVRINAWWNTLDHLPKLRASLDEQAEEFRALFFDACRLRLRSDVPLATALSGGLDSSAVACTLAELGRRGAVAGAPKDWQRAFVACFTGTPYDERQYAKTVIDHTGYGAVLPGCPMPNGRSTTSKRSSSIMRESIGRCFWGCGQFIAACKIAGPKTVPRASSHSCRLDWWDCDSDRWRLVGRVSSVCTSAASSTRPARADARVGSPPAVPPFGNGRSSSALSWSIPPL
jgi:hypothetical protein